MSEYFGYQKNKCNSKNKFSFSFVEQNVIRREIYLLQVKETAQYTEIPAKITKEDFDLVQDFTQNLNYCIALSDFATVLKWAVKLHKFTERIPRAQKKLIDLVYFTECFKNLSKV